MTSPRTSSPQQVSSARPSLNESLSSRLWSALSSVASAATSAAGSNGLRSVSASASPNGGDSGRESPTVGSMLMPPPLWQRRSRSQSSVPEQQQQQKQHQSWIYSSAGREPATPPPTPLPLPEAVALYSCSSVASDALQREFVHLKALTTDLERKRDVGKKRMSEMDRVLAQQQQALDENQRQMERCDTKLLSVLDALKETKELAEKAKESSIKQRALQDQLMADIETRQNRLKSAELLVQTLQAELQTQAYSQQLLVDRIAEQTSKMYHADAKRSKAAKHQQTEVEAGNDNELFLKRQSLAALQHTLKSVAAKRVEQQQHIEQLQSNVAELLQECEQLERRRHLRERSFGSLLQEQNRMLAQQSSLQVLVNAEKRQVGTLVQQKFAIINSIDALVGRKSKLLDALEMLAQEKTRIAELESWLRNQYQDQQQKATCSIDSCQSEEAAQENTDKVPATICERMAYVDDGVNSVAPLRPGKLTLTTLLLMFEADDDASKRICVDLSDIASCSCGPNLLHLDLRIGLHNRFDEATSTVQACPDKLVFTTLPPRPTVVSRVHHQLQIWLEMHRELASNEELPSLEESLASTLSTDAESESGALSSPIDIDIEGSSEVVSDEMLHDVLQLVPVRFHFQSWRCLYSLSRNGMSLAQLYRLCSGSKASVVLISNTRDRVFGAFLSCPLGVQKSFFGSGETFVFELDCKSDGGIRRYNWSGRNSFFILNHSDSISIGGGSNYAIYLDKSLRFGSSGACDTFSSPVLSGNEQFHVRRLEVWGMNS